MMARGKLISAEDLFLSMRDDPEINAKHFARIKEHIDHAPDAVVRCENCRYCRNWVKWNGGGYFACCRIPSEAHDVDPYHFCSYGERREGE